MKTGPCRRRGTSFRVVALSSKSFRGPIILYSLASAYMISRNWPTAAHRCVQLEAVFSLSLKQDIHHTISRTRRVSVTSALSYLVVREVPLMRRP